MFKDTSTAAGSPCGRFAVPGVILLAALVALAGCNNGGSARSGDANPDGPQIVAAQYIDVNGNGVDAGDVVVVTFERPVRISSSRVDAFLFASSTDSFGTSATQSQTVPGSDRIEITLGTSPSLLPDTSSLNLVNSTAINVRDMDGKGARRSAGMLTVGEFTFTAPTLVGCTYNDADLDGTIDAGDTLLCAFDKPIDIPGGQTVAGNFATPVTSDSFGAGATLSALSGNAANRGALITLGTSPVLTVSGTFDAAMTTAGSPSGISMVASPGITDTTASASAVTGGTTVDLGEQTSSRYYILEKASLFPGNVDATSPDVSANGFFSPHGVSHFDDSVTIGANTYSVDLLFVADTENNRVLIFDGNPTGNNASASVVLGQPDMFSNFANGSEYMPSQASYSKMNQPTDVQYDPDTNKLFVCDSGNNRILVFNGVIDGATGLLALTDGINASYVLGQTNGTSSSANQGGGPTSRTLWNPTGLYVAGGQLAVADSGNNRVLIWSSIPTSSNTAASTVLGQASFVANLANGGGSAGAATLSSPMDVVVDPSLSVNASSGAVFIADTGNNRVLVFETSSPASGASADVVLGQANFTATSAATSASGLSSPNGIATDAASGTLFVADLDNHRVMVYDFSGGLADGAAGAAVGQADQVSGMENRGGAPAANTLSFPRGVAVSRAASSPQFFIADTENHRVLVFSSLPTVAGANADAADLEQGQPSFTTSEAKGHTMNEPSSVVITGGSMIVADTLNNRVLIYSSVPTAGDPTPDVVVGQGGIDDTLENQGGTASLATLKAPEGVATDGIRLVVADTGNNRVLVFNSIPTADGTAADVVLGQSSGSGTSPNAGGITGARMDSPTGVAVSGTKLFVCDRDNHRVLIFSDITALVSGDAADIVVGQQDFSSNLPNQGDVTRPNHMNAPNGVCIDGSVMYVADTGNSRVLGFLQIPTVNGADADFAIGQNDLNSSLPSASSVRLDTPMGVATDGTHLVISDTGNNRIMIYDTPPLTSDPAADVVLGQSSFNNGSANRGGGASPNAAGLRSPRGLFFNGLDLWIADRRNGRLSRFR